MTPRNTDIPGNNPGNTPSSGKKADTTSPEKIKAAHDQAERDIEQDPDLSIHSPNDDLDESESARLGEDKTDLV